MLLAQNSQLPFWKVFTWCIVTAIFTLLDLKCIFSGRKINTSVRQTRLFFKLPLDMITITIARPPLHHAGKQRRYRHPGILVKDLVQHVLSHKTIWHHSLEHPPPTSWPSLRLPCSRHQLSLQMPWQRISNWQCLGSVSLTTSPSLLPSPARAHALVIISEY